MCLIVDLLIIVSSFAVDHNCICQNSQQKRSNRMFRIVCSLLNIRPLPVIRFGWCTGCFSFSFGARVTVA